MKSNFSILSGVLGLVMLLPFGVCAGVVTPISSSLYLYTDVNAGIGPAFDDDGTSQLGTLNTMSRSVSAVASSPGGNASSFMEAAASWTSAAAGQIVFHSIFTTDNLTAYRDARVGAGYNPNFVYTFRSDSAAIFTMSCTSAHIGPYPYATYFSASGKTGDNYLQSVSLSGPSTDVLSFAVQPGITYTLWIAEGSNLNHNLPAFTLESFGTFNFQITPVPEPSSFACSVLGMLLLARGRRTLLATGRR